MKKSTNYFSRVLGALLLCAGMVMTSCYDDSSILGRMKSYEERLSKLEAICNKQNTNIESLQTIVAALQDKDYVTNVAPITEGEKTLGYTITFSKSGSVTIYNGEDGTDGQDGSDGVSPVIGVRQDTDGIYYWTLDGQWLTDSVGNKLRASAQDGADGAPGLPGEAGTAGITPKLRIVDGYWYVSYDGGQTWEDQPLGQATGDKGDSLFSGVSYDEDYLYIRMAGGETLTIPRTSSDQGGDGPMTWSLDEVTEVSATFTGALAVAASDLSFSQVTVYYSDAETFNVNDARKASTTTFDGDQKFTITVAGLKPNVKYNYCLVAEVKSEKTYGDVKDFTTVSLVAPTLDAALDVKTFSATISGKVNLPSEIATGLEYGFQYSTSQDFSSNVVIQKVTDLDSENKFSVKISSLTYLTIYYFRSYIEVNGVSVCGEPKTFKTLQPSSSPSGYTDLASTSPANCYIVSQGGSYCFPVVRGNASSDWLSQIEVSEVLWESFGTDVVPSVGDLVKAVSYQRGYITFQTANTFKEGNAVIAAKDASGNILWSWHIWFTDQPQKHVYNNTYSTMMDRNLGATSATPGDVGALGLLYQWGRKDPFLGSSSIHNDYMAEARSTISWPSAVESDSSNGTIAYATAHPTTFIKNNNSNDDWYYTGSSSTDNTRWTTYGKPKSIYDPCPSGWRVPDGGSSGIWSKALGSSSYFEDSSLYNSANKGINFSGKFGSASTIWYPASGYRNDSDGSLSNVGYYGSYWSASPVSNGSGDAYGFGFYNNGGVLSSGYSNRACGHSVRCIKY